jgi:hypothetical protein
LTPPLPGPIPLARYKDSTPVHLLVGGLVCFFVMAPALFTPYGFGPDYTNHLWLVWQQGEAISNNLHPTLYLQINEHGIFEPFYGFYGGTLYAIAGALSALAGNHPYPVYVASFGVCAALAYGGMWWLGRQLGLSRWVAHLPAFVVVTAAYYLTDAYARGAWPEFVAVSSIPLFLAGALYLLTRPWRAVPVLLFVLATVVLTGSHNITLLWSVIVIGPTAVVLWFAAKRSRPASRTIVAVLALGVAAVAINAWFLLIDARYAADTMAWAQNLNFLQSFGGYFYFDNVWNVLDPLRQTPVQSDTYGLTIAAPIAAFLFGLVVLGLGWEQVRAGSRLLRATWWILLTIMAVLVVLLVMPASWWVKLGTPFTDIQFPYRLAGWLLMAIGVQLVVTLRLARAMPRRRRRIAAGLAAVLVLLTIVQASAQLYSSTRLNEETHFVFHTRTDAFASGPTGMPASYYAEGIYANYDAPVVEPGSRAITLETPKPGQTKLEETVPLPEGPGAVATNVIGGPYVVKIEGMKLVGRTSAGLAVVEPPANHGKTARVTVTADAGGTETAGVVISILGIVVTLALIAFLAFRPPTDVWSAPLRVPRRRRQAKA